MASGLEGVKALSDLTGVQEQINSLKENTTGGIWSKFKAHASRVMTRPGATRQAVGASALILGGLAKAGLLVGISTFLGASISFPPAAAGIALAGGALFLVCGLYKGYHHAKEVANQKAQDNNQLSASTKEQDNNQIKASTKDIALEFVKQTAENIIFGVPTLLLKFIPSIHKKLEACAEKYEAKQDVKEGAAKISEQIGRLKNIQVGMAKQIGKAKETVNQKISDAKNQIQGEIKNKAKEILETQVSDLKDELSSYYEPQLNQLKTIRDIAKENIQKAISNPAFERQKETLGKILKRIDAASDAGLQKLQNQLSEILKIDLGINDKLKSLRAQVEEQKSLLSDNTFNELRQKYKDTQAALTALTNNSIDIEGGAQQILQDAKTQAREACQKTIKENLKKEVQACIQEGEQSLSNLKNETIQNIQRELAGAFAVLEKSTGSSNLGAGELAKLKEHVEQTIKNFTQWNLETEVSTLIDSFDFEQDIDLENAFQGATQKVTSLTESLAKDAAETIVQAGISKAQFTGSKKLGRTMGKANSQFNGMGLTFEEQ